MPHEYACDKCGVVNYTLIDPEGGDRQRFVEDCRACCHPNVINARYNAVTRSYDIDVYLEDRG